jgi:3-hydroxyacyl-CoA dehydrogenase/enoyl-CoA hydratase/3-hydroxybutyryl-CoA epimerase
MAPLAEILGTRATVELSLPSTTLLVDSDCLGWVVMDSASVRSANVINLEFVTEMSAVLARVEALSTSTPRRIKCVIFWSDKKDSFVAGADVKSIFPVTEPALAQQAAEQGQKLFQRIASLRIPSIAAINGSCLGGGLELALHCSKRIAANGDYRIGLPEVQLGLLPGAGGTVMMPKLIGLQASLGLILPGKTIVPANAKKTGIVDVVAEGKDRFPGEHCFFNEVRKYASRCVDRPFKRAESRFAVLYRNPVVNHVMRYMTTKQLDKTTKGRYPAPYAAMESVLHGSYSFEAKQFGRLATTPEAKNLMSLFLMQDQIKKQTSSAEGAVDIKGMTVGVIGAGVMGSAIAQLAAQCGFSVYMRDIKDEFVAKGMSNIAGLFDELVKKKRMTKADADAKKALVRGGTSMEPFANCGLVIEAAVERMDLKKKILADVEAINPNGIFATNTSSLSVEELAKTAKRPQNVLGLHFFNPVAKMPLVEVITTSATDPQNTLRVTAFALALKKTPVQCRDGPGFIVNRILGIYMGEATHLLSQGVDIETIDAAIKEFGMPMGPFRLMDEVGLDVAFHVAPILNKGLGDRFAMNPAFGRLVDMGFLGKKNGKGFYLYDAKGKSTGLNPDLAKVLGSIVNSGSAPAKGKVSKQEIIDRCVLLMVNEASHILADGVASRSEDVDVGMVFGTGFPPFRGGVLQYAEQRGLKDVVDSLKRLEARYGSRFRVSALLEKKAQEGGRFFPERPLVPFREGRRPIFRAKM